MTTLLGAHFVDCAKDRVFDPRHPAQENQSFDRKAPDLGATMPKPRVTKHEAHDFYLKVVRKMKTFVCEGCYGEELCEHPTLGQDWTPEWYLAMAKLAKEQGWEIVPPPVERKSWFFKEFQLLGPKCATKRHAG